jgi:hypothetical protein
MLRAITLVVCTYSILLVAVALPGIPSGPSDDYGSKKQPKVDLFKLAVEVTPPAPAVLKYVYQGFGKFPHPKLILINAGTQNYTCNATTNTYSTSGTAVAKLLDVTQFYAGDAVPLALPAIQDLDVVGSHYYVPNPLNAAGAAIPRFENHKDFFIGTKNNSVPSLAPAFSVATVLLQNIQVGNAGGNLADWVVRTYTLGGVTPVELNTCKDGDTIAIPYKAQYLFFKNGQ